MNVVIKISSRFGMIDLGEITLAGVTKRCVPYIVAESNRFYKIKIKIKHGAYRASYTRNQLNVKGATGDIVVLIE